jgi:predicted P-loop ATPase
VKNTSIATAPAEVVEALTPEESKRQKRNQLDRAKRTAVKISKKQKAEAKRVERGFALPPSLLVEDDGSVRPTYTNALLLLEQQDWGFAYDVTTGAYLFRAESLPWNVASFGRMMNDKLVIEIRDFLHYNTDAEFTKAHIREAVETVCQKHPVEPVVEFFESLPAWDGTARVASWLTDYCGAVCPEHKDGDSDEEREWKQQQRDYVSAVGSLTLVGAVKRTYEPGCKFDTMLVMEGEIQGKGKSGMLQELGGEFYSDPDISDVNDKDTVQKTQGKLIIEWAELDVATRADLNRMKAYSSRQVDRIRPPYGHGVEEFPRRGIFIATTNESIYLQDPTGNRRYLPVETGDLSPDAMRRDRLQLWAEALAMYRAGFSVVLPEALWDVARTIQSSRAVEDPWADLIANHLAENPEITFVTTAEILRDAIEMDGNGMRNADSKRVAGILRRMGWRAIKPRVAGEANPKRGFERVCPACPGTESASQ